MNNIPKIILATSISPKNIKVQQAAIKSWKSIGFEVLSINLATEIDDLEKAFPNVEFLPVRNLDTKHTERKLVYLDQIFDALKERCVDISGIINSDIELRVDQSFLHSISRAAMDSLVFGSRVNIDSPGDAEGKSFRLGFDYFFFTKKMLREFPSSLFRLGAPWWDLWLPLTSIALGFNTKYLVDAIGYHIRHQGGWETDTNSTNEDGNLNSEWHTYALLFIEALTSLGKNTFQSEGCSPIKQGDPSWSGLCQFLTIRQLIRYSWLVSKAPSLMNKQEVLSAIRLSAFGFVESLAVSLPEYVINVSKEISFEAGKV
jgi:hypothetical protein